MHLLYLVNSYPNLLKDFIPNNKIKDDLNEFHTQIALYNSNWLSDFYLISKKKNFKSDIIFPNLFFYDKFNYKNSREYLREIIEKNNFIDCVICGADFPELRDILIENKKKIGKVVLWYSTNLDEFGVKNFINFYDKILSDNDKIVRLCQNYKINSSKLLISIPERLISKNENFYDRSDSIFFSGSINSKFSSRYKILKFLINEKLSVEFRLRDLQEESIFFRKINFFLRKYFSKFHKFLYKKKIIPVKNIFKKMNKEEVQGRKMIQTLNSFKFCINIHSDFDKNEAINLRVFEAISQGTLLFCDTNSLMQKYFTNYKHVVYFDDERDLIKKIKFYKTNLAEAKKISDEAVINLKQSHTAEKRFDEFIRLIN